MAKIPARHLLKHFVDRVREMAEFDKMLKGSGVYVLCIQAPGGRGKSQLLHRMMEECDLQGVSWVSIEWEDSRKYNYLDIMRQIREQSNQDVLFQLFNDQVNSYMKPEYTVKIQLEGSTIENIHVLESGEIQQSNITVHAGHNVEIKDCNISIPRPDRDLGKIEFKLTESFMPCLRTCTSKAPLVVFLDALEKVDDPTRTWISKEFLTQVRDHDINNLFVVLAGRQEFPLDPSFFSCRVVYDLRLLEREHIRDYLSKQGFVENVSDVLVETFYSWTQGDPLQLANAVEAVRQSAREK